MKETKAPDGILAIGAVEMNVAILSPPACICIS